MNAVQAILAGGVTIINATPHAVHIVEPAQGGRWRTVHTYFQSGTEARVLFDTRRQPDLLVKGGHPVRLHELTPPRLCGLPAQRPDVAYIVSGIAYVAGTLQGRTDLLMPGDQIYRGRKPIGCRGLSGGVGL